jgi:hypothetical protein
MLSLNSAEHDFGSEAFLEKVARLKKYLSLQQLLNEVCFIEIRPE